MFDPRIGTFLRRAARLIGRQEPTTTDAALLDRLACNRDPAAFTELVARHGPAVWALCRRLVRSEPDAEDVFQATFLVLTRDAARVRKAASVGSWLYGVAFRLGRKARARRDRLPDSSRRSPPAAPPDPVVAMNWNEVRAALDEELARLPDVLRAPILLCYFGGMTQDEAAVDLGWTQRAVKSRVARGRDLLRKRLTQRGIELPAALSVPLLSAEIASAIPPRLLSNLMGVAENILRRQPPGPTASPTAIALAQTEVPTMSFLRLAIPIVAVAGLVAAGSLIGRPDDPIAAVNAALLNEADPSPTTRENDPALPQGEVRIGTTQFRTVSSGYKKKTFYTSDGKTLIAPLGNTVELWDAESGRRLHEIPVPNAGIQNADFAAGSNLLALFGTFRPTDPSEEYVPTLWLVDTAARKVIRILRMPDVHAVFHLVRLTRDGKRVVTATDGEVRVWDVKSGEELIRQQHPPQVSHLAVSPDGKTIMYGNGYQIFQWKWESGEEPKKFASIVNAGEDSIAFTPDGKTLCAGGRGGKITLFEVHTGRQTGTLDVGTSAAYWSFSPDGQTLAVVHADPFWPPVTAYNITLWNTATGHEAARFSVGRTRAWHVNWSPDGARLAATTDHLLWAWDVKTRKPLAASSPGHEDSIWTLAFAPDGRLFTASSDHTIRSWDSATGKPGLELIHDSAVYGLAVSPDGSLVAGSPQSDLMVWDAKAGRERFHLLGDRMLKVQFTADGKRLVAWADSCYLRVWDTRNGKLLAEHRILPNGMTEAQRDDEGFLQQTMMMLHMASISGDGSTFALGYRGVQIFDIETGKERMNLKGDENGISAFALSPDGKRIAIASHGKQIETRLPDGSTRNSPVPEHQIAVWDLTTMKPIWQAKSNGNWSMEVNFSPDGLRLGEAIFSVGDGVNDRVQVWDATTGKDLGRIDLPHHCDRFTFDRRGKRLAVALANTTAVVYDLETALKP